MHYSEVLYGLAKRTGVVIEEGPSILDHIHICISIQPRYAVSNVVGYLKGKNAISIARRVIGCQWFFTGEHFWARGYLVSMAGYNKDMVIEYVRSQEKGDKQKY